MNHSYNNKYKFKNQFLRMKHFIWSKVLLNNIFPFSKLIHMCTIASMTETHGFLTLIVGLQN